MSYKETERSKRPDKWKERLKQKTETDMDHGLNTDITFRELGRWSISGPGVHNLGLVLTGALFCPTIPAHTHTERQNAQYNCLPLFHYPLIHQHSSEP